VHDDVVIDRLATVDLFSGMSRRELKRLAAGARDVVHTDGNRIIDEGGPGLGFHYILEGNATVSRPDGRSVELGEGDYFGEMSLIDGLPRSASVSAKGTLRTLSLDSSTFNSLLDEHPEASRSIMKAMSRRLRALDQ
jgi:CRP-like cAMP-binding protein